MIRAAGLSRRPETDADEAFLRALYAEVRAAELAPVPWDDAVKDAFLRQQFDAQRAHYRREFPQAAFDVIVRDGRPIGRLSLDQSGPEWRLLDIILAADQRGQGLGTALLRALLADADAAGRPVLLHVEPDNPARRLYERLGFLPLAGSSSDGFYLSLLWTPPACR
jgi:ribosomal protein S18 acetylase RimI-like enzyme